MPNAVITGATQGIGKAIAETFLKNGCDVAICARTQSDIDNITASWNKQYPERKILAYCADLSSKEQTQAFAGEVLKSFGAVDILVNNAGLFFPGKLMEEKDGFLKQMIEVNLYSAYYLTRALVPSIKQSEKGHIFNMCSVASLKAYPNGGSYGISKYALLGFSDNLRQELMEDNIMVTAISPGATYSRSWQGADVERERLMEPQDVADMVWTAYNLSNKATVEHIVMRPAKGDL